jgi:glycosyltransferase involved in cell wall biosynthesis
LAHRLDTLLLRAVSSLEWCTAVYIGWTGSASLEEAKKYVVDAHRHITVLKLEAVTDFSAARNTLLAKVPDDWVFFLDSDEEILQADRSEFSHSVMESMSKSDKKIGLVRRKDVFYGKVLQYGEVGTVWVQRLLPPGARFERTVHETVSRNFPEVRLSKPIYHFAHESISTFIQKIRFYAELDAKHRIAVGQHFFIWQFLNPVGKFLQNYVFRLGFADGWQGLVYASIMSLHSLSVRCLHYELDQKEIDE